MHPGTTEWSLEYQELLSTAKWYKAAVHQLILSSFQFCTMQMHPTTRVSIRCILKRDLTHDGRYRSSFLCIAVHKLLPQSQLHALRMRPVIPTAWRINTLRLLCTREMHVQTDSCFYFLWLSSTTTILHVIMLSCHSHQNCVVACRGPTTWGIPVHLLLNNAWRL